MASAAPASYAPACLNVPCVQLRHEILTFLGFVCGDICQHVQSWPHCIARLHAAGVISHVMSVAIQPLCPIAELVLLVGVFHAAMHVFFSFPTSSMVHVHVVSMFTGLLDYCTRAVEDGTAPGSNVPALVSCALLPIHSIITVSCRAAAF